MAVLDHLAQAAAVLLLVELLVILALFLAITGGLAFGVHWVRGKTDWAFGLVNGYLPLIGKYTRLGTDYAGLPFVKAGGFAETLQATLRTLERQIRDLQTSAHSVGARPGSRPATPAAEVTVVEPLPPTRS